ncbi:hypothetical protein [Anaeromicrobium sediminis]|uniref:Uncharacterized protein n=1 Tax=Anaeromicrobium sediminis TaxID=1478221 RepID=A0A267MB83_9FIRM|nr:hypothetical protein [Anaeromicrobium sediminis]PAB56816.1 hypothetical protein CCE28_20285 [Anaeromicrobium sediminis]
MLSIVRSGPKTLVIETNNLKKLSHFLKDDLRGVPYDRDTASTLADDNSSIAFLTTKMKDVVTVADVDYILLIPKDIEKVLSTIISHNKSHLIASLRIAPKIIMMKYLGDVEKTIESISNDYKGIIGTFDEIMEAHTNGVVISFTKENLSSPVSLSNIYDKAVYVKGNFNHILKSLHKKSLKYLNIGMGNKDWYELTIKIYDSYGQYKLHYERLLHIIENLELGLVLGESWGTDAATIFYTVGIYRVRLVTFYPPEYIKKILLGLEYLEDGKRIIDLDLFYKRKKVHWDELRTKEIKKKTDLSKKFREKILDKLKENDRDVLFQYEKEILKNTY